MGVLDSLKHQDVNLISEPIESYVKKKQYEFHEVLGHGTFGEVKRAVWTRPKDGAKIDVAVKVVKKKALKSDVNQIFDEIKVLKGLDHPNIVKFYDDFESKDKYYLVFQLASGGELFEVLAESPRIHEEDAIKLVKDVLSGIKYLHDHDIVHRDIKPENIIYLKKGSSDIVIADFGIAKHLDHGEQLTSLAGSPGYAAPEVLLQKGHGKPVDLWSLGILTYVLLNGFLPFRATSKDDLIRECSEARIHYKGPNATKVSPVAKDFIAALVKPDPDDRPTAEQALKHAWLTTYEPTREHDLSGNVREYVQSRKNAKFRSAASTIMASNRFKQAAAAATATNGNARQKGSDTDDDDDDDGYHTSEEANDDDTSETNKNKDKDVDAISDKVQQLRAGSR